MNMNKAIFRTLREQSAIGFDGKIIFLNADTGQQVGFILICNGLIVGASFNKQTGRKALINLLVEEFSSVLNLNHIVEPEVINVDTFQFEITLDELENDFRSLYEKIESSKKLRPPGNKRLLVDADFVCRGLKIDPFEFDLMCLISDFGKVEEIYNNSELLEFEVTNALVSLRKKGAIKVIS